MDVDVDVDVRPKQLGKSWYFVAWLRAVLGVSWQCAAPPMPHFTMSQQCPLQNHSTNLSQKTRLYTTLRILRLSACWKIQHLHGKVCVSAGRPSPLLTSPRCSPASQDMTFVNLAAFEFAFSCSMTCACQPCHATLWAEQLPAIS